MKTLNAAVIGTGFIGPAHLEALRRIGGVEIVAIASLDAEKAHDLAGRFAIPRIYADWRDVIADRQVEVIHNCTPNNLHFEINKRAVLAGKHIVSEKPLTLTAKESDELLRLVRKSGVVNAVNFNYRFYPLVQQARHMVRSGALGTTLLVHGHYLQDWLLYDTDYNWRLESGISGASRAMADIGSHWCDLVQFMTGLEITEVFAELATVHPKRKKPAEHVDTFKGKETRHTDGAREVAVDTEDAAFVTIRFNNGARGACTISQVSAGRKNRQWIEIDGTKKALSWNQEEPNVLWTGSREAANEILMKDPSLLDEKVRRYAHYPGGHPEGYPDGPMNLFANVYDFIRAGKDPRRDPTDFPTFADGHRENLIVEAVLASAKTHRWTTVFD